MATAFNNYQVTFEGEVFTVIEDARTLEMATNFYELSDGAEAWGTDSEGNTVLIVWEISEYFNAEEAMGDWSEACDWENPIKVIRY